MGSMKKLIHLVVIGWALFQLYSKGPAVTAAAHNAVKELANTQQACARHTAAANEVIDFAAAR